ncbi:MAG: Crp/Fnr family transcriptional regulator [Thermoactinomyces sp.]
MDSKINFLRRVSLFSEMTEEELGKIAQITDLRHYPRNSTIFVEAQERTTIYFIQSGSIKITRVDNNGNEQVITLLQKGDMFPHVGFFDDSPYPGTAQTITDCKLLAISIKDFDRLLNSNPQMAKSVMKIMARKILQLQSRLQVVISGDVHQKVVMSLLRLVQEYGIVKEDGILISIPLTHQDLANMLGMSRESVNRVLNQLKKEKILNINRKGILIYNLDSLENKLSLK